MRGPLATRLPAAEWHAVRDWWTAFLASDVPGWPHRTLSHGDPWWENLLVDESGLAGILDWEYISSWDPANDLGVTLNMGEAFFQHLLARYREQTSRDDPTLEQRARLLAASRVFYGFEFAIVRDDDSEWEDSFRSLRESSILRGT